MLVAGLATEQRGEPGYAKHRDDLTLHGQHSFGQGQLDGAWQTEVHGSRRSTPLVSTRARNPPRPRSQSSAPGPSAEFIQ